jgi:hypothetical protein
MGVVVACVFLPLKVCVRLCAFVFGRAQIAGIVNSLLFHSNRYIRAVRRQKQATS